MKQLSALDKAADQLRNLRNAVQAGQQRQQLFPVPGVFRQGVFQRHMAHPARFGFTGVGSQERKGIFLVLPVLDQMEKDSLRNPQTLVFFGEVQLHCALIVLDFPGEHGQQLRKTCANPVGVDPLRTDHKGYRFQKRLHLVLGLRQAYALPRQLQFALVRQATEEGSGHELQITERRFRTARKLRKSQLIESCVPVLFKRLQQRPSVLRQQLRLCVYDIPRFCDHRARRRVFFLSDHNVPPAYDKGIISAFPAIGKPMLMFPLMDEYFSEIAKPYLDYAAIGTEYYAERGGAFTGSGYALRRKNAEPLAHNASSLSKRILCGKNLPGSENRKEQGPVL